MVEYKGSVSFGSNDGIEETSPLVIPTAPPEDQEDALSVRVEQVEDPEHERMVGAGVASGVVGLLLGGPFFGLLLGFGTAYATNKEGAAGDAARAVGDVALVAKTKAIEVDEKHQIVSKSKVAANDAWERAKELDRRHHVLEKSKDFVVFSWQKILEINREHRVLERAVEGVGRMMAFLLDKLTEKLNHNNRDDNDNNTAGDSWTEETTATVVQEQDKQAK